MKTSTAIITVVLTLALMGAIVWQGISMWYPTNGVVLPAASPPSQQIGGVSLPTPASQSEIIVPRTAPPPAPALPPESSTAPSPVQTAPAQGAPAQGASAQGASTQGAPTQGSPAPTATQKPIVDETALRYFARQGDTRRLNTEIARLHSLHPDWVPPDDPLKEPPVSDPQLDAMWQLYTRGQFAATHAAIAARQTSQPGWAPPKDLLERLAVAETRERLINASDAKQYMTVVQLATATPSLLTCGDVDVLWRVAEAFAKTDRASRALDAYRYVLTNCTEPRDRLSTLQKAMTLLPHDQLQPLLALGHSGPDGDEFRSIREDLARSAVAAGLSDPKVVVDDADLKLLENAANANHSASDAMLIGGYLLRHDDPTQAEHWYRLAYDRQNTAQSAQGLALALLGLKRWADAENVLARWRDTNDDAGKVYLAAVSNLLAEQPPPILGTDVLARIVPTVAARRDAATAQQLGWYAHAFGQEETAANWFAAALSWKPDDEPSAYGLSITNMALNRRDAVKTLVRSWASRSLRIRALVDPAAAKALAASGGASAQVSQTPAIAPAPPNSAVSPLPQTAPQATAPPAPAAAIVRQQPGVAQGTAPTTSVPGIAQSYATQSKAAQTIVPDSYEPAPAEPRTTRKPRASAGSGSSAGNGQCGGGMAGAWCMMQLDRPAEAVTRFRAVLSNGSAKDRQDAAYGLSLAYLRLGLTSEAAAASSQAPQPGGRVKELSTAILTQRILADYQAGRYADALIGLDSRAHLAPEQTDLLILRGWCYFHLHRYGESKQVFTAAAATGRADAASALVAVQEAIKGH